MALLEPAAPHVDDADVGIGPVRGNPIGLDEVLRVSIDGGGKHQREQHDDKFNRRPPPFPLQLKHPMASLEGVSVLIAGAGLAGLAAARDLFNPSAPASACTKRASASGGRVWTVRNGFSEHQHAEAGGDMIDEGHHEIRRLAEELRLPVVKILRSGFGYARPDTTGRVRILTRTAARGWDRLDGALRQLTREYVLAEQRWESPIVGRIARRSVAQWLDEVGADRDLRATATGLRGFFLADPEELSLVALVDQFASSDQPAAGDDVPD